MSGTPKYRYSPSVWPFCQSTSKVPDSMTFVLHCPLSSHSRPQLPQQQQQQVAQDALLYPTFSGSTSSSSRQQGPARPGQLLSPPSRNGLSTTPRQQQRAAQRLDDSDTRMAAYDSCVVQVCGAQGGRQTAKGRGAQSVHCSPIGVWSVRVLECCSCGAHLQQVVSHAVCLSA